MAKRVEIEKKFYCENIKKLEQVVMDTGFKLVETSHETDEYFTDIDSIFIKNRTCLRIRKTNEERMELTFKGKSKELTNLYAKTENNISLDIKEYKDTIGFLSTLGYYSYAIVNKKRLTYSHTDNDLTYNVMIDQINELGNFVEFEILSTDDNQDMHCLKEKLDHFIEKFASIHLESADLPYRDFVAKSMYEKLLPSDTLTTIFLDLDGTLINSELAFFTSFKKILKEIYNVEITMQEYQQYELKQNAQLIPYLKNIGKISKEVSYEEIIQFVYNEYENRFQNLLLEPETILNFELLKRVKEKNIKLGLVTTSKRKFIDILVQTLKIDTLFDVIVTRDDVSNLKPSPDAYLKALEALQENSAHCIAIEDSDRGIEAARASKIKTVKVDGFNLIKQDNQKIFTVDSVSRILFFLMNYLK
ncbi:MAG: class IV adenylate cyclase [Bacilli bacterium]|nr:class IV adenylate cyclase [Bacilli bacterium]